MIAIGLVLVFIVYLLIVGTEAIALVRSGSFGAVVAGVLLLLLPVAGLLAVWRELRFSARVKEMGKRLEDEGGPTTEIEGQGHNEADPADWRSWYVLASTYDAEGDHKKARAAMRHALTLYS